MEAKPIVFFDGICGLCNWSINWIFRLDKNGRFQFSTLQGKTAATLLSESDRKELNTFILYQNGQLYRRSQAIAYVLKELGGFCKLLAVMILLFPKFIRDGVYNLIAKYRYRFFGRREICRIPTPAERMRFLE